MPTVEVCPVPRSPRRVGRWLGALACAWCLLVVFASCGGVGQDNLRAADASYDGPVFAPTNLTCGPKSCASRGYDCGWNGDECGMAVQCGTCTGSDFCGGGGFSRCGSPPPDGSACKPSTCASLGYTCGTNGDGCGGMVDCGATCASPAYCGGGGFSRCGTEAMPDAAQADAAPRCTPTTCAAQGLACGPAGDGCGNALDCGACPAGQTCGGGGTPGACGAPPSCTGLCAQRPTCAANTTTTITGTVRAAVSSWVPSGTTPDPVPGVLVYVPTSTVAPFAAGAHCGTCSADVSGDPLVWTTTSFDGTFTLSNVPVSKSSSDTIPVVIQLGRWRRQFAFVVSKSCAENPVGTLNMPSVESATSDIPLTAISTGAVDSLECVLLKMGVDASEFTTNNAAQPGRIHLYAAPNTADSDNHGPGAYIPAPHGGMQPDETTLMGAPSGSAATGGTYMQYDQIMLPCWGAEYFKQPGQLANLVTYAKGGGHFFATHFSYTWLYQNDLFASTAQWDVNSDVNPNYTVFTGNVSTTVPPPVASPPGLFVRWLNYVGALNNANPSGAPPSPATVAIAAGRHDVDKVLGSSVDWIDGSDPNQSGPAAQMLLHFTFDVNGCGHAIFSDFHVVNQGSTNSVVFPNECDTKALTAQERVLEYMIWNLASCPGATPEPGCKPRSCADQHISCGPAGDGCGGALQCGSCTAPQTCGGGGVLNQCGGGSDCKPKTCVEEGVFCGPSGDGCGGVLQCGKCVAPQTCGGGGVPGQCGGGSTCTPQTCAEQNIACGPTGDGCGNLLQCGTCVSPETCGGGGVPGQCGGSVQR